MASSPCLLRLHPSLCPAWVWHSAPSTHTDEGTTAGPLRESIVSEGRQVPPSLCPTSPPNRGHRNEDTCPSVASGRKSQGELCEQKL